MPKRKTPQKAKTQASSDHPPVSINLYRNLAFSFLATSALILFVTGAFTFSRAKIIITRGEVSENFDLFFNVGKGVNSAEVVDGNIAEIIETQKGDGKVLGGQTQFAPARGQIIIYNKRAIGQTLIPTTRLLSPEGYLFRLKNRVTIPAGGQIKTDVYADKPGKDGEIGPTTFTIPGLSVDLQKLIYAESKESMRGGEVSISSLGQEDIDRAYADLLRSIEEAGKMKLQDKLVSLAPSDPYYIYKSEVLEQSADTKLGKEVSIFGVKQTAHIVGIVFGGRELLDSVQSSLKGLISKDDLLLPVDLKDLEVTISEADAKLNQARLKVIVRARTRPAPETPEFAKERFFGLTKQEAGRYLGGIEGVTSYKIKMPFYLKRIPKNPSRIVINVK